MVAGMAAMAAFFVILWITKTFMPPVVPATQPDSQPEKSVSGSAATTRPEAGATSQPGVSTSQPSIGAAPTSSGAIRATTQPETLVRLGALDKADSDSKQHFCMEVELTSQGAGVKSARLADYFQTPKNQDHYAIIPDSDTPRLAAASIKVQGETVDLSGAVWRAGQPTTQPDGSEEVSFVCELFPVDKGGPIFESLHPLLTLTKTFTLKTGLRNAGEGYDLRVRYAISNHTGQPLPDVALADDGVKAVPTESVRADDREIVWSAGKNLARSSVAEAAKDPAKLKEKLPATGAEETSLRWVAIANRFFVIVVRPADPSKVSIKFEAKNAPGQQDPDLLTLGWTADKLAVPADPNSPAVLEFVDFLGPKSGPLLQSTPEYINVFYKGLINYGGACCIPGAGGMCLTDQMAPFMVWLLEIIHIVLPNYGWAIMVLVVIVRLLLHPLTRKSQISMSKMSKLAPKIEELKKKYGDNKEELNKATAEFYRQEGFSPLLGCLPMLLQMPIWIALWAGLNTAIELRHAPFMFWINDLATPDAIMTWAAKPVDGFVVPLVGGMTGPIYGLNILPLLLMIAMFLQQVFTPKPAGQQAGQQKFMMWFMTVFFGLMFYNMPSGLTLYVMASTAVGAGESYVIRKHIKQKEEAEARGEVDAPRFKGPQAGQVRRRKR